MVEYSEAWQSFRDLNFKNSLESHFSFNKKCLVGRTVMIQRALHSPDIGKRFTYAECMRTMHRKFSTGFWSQSLWQKPQRKAEYSEAWQSFRNLNFKNPPESHFSLNKKCFMGRTPMIQSALHSSDLGKFFTYSERMRKTHRKFSRGFWSQSLWQKPT